MRVRPLTKVTSFAGLRSWSHVVNRYLNAQSRLEQRNGYQYWSEPTISPPLRVEIDCQTLWLCGTGVHDITSVRGPLDIGAIIRDIIQPARD